MNDVPIQRLMTALHKSWSIETSFTPDEWTPQNPARGHCLVSTLVLQEYLGGDIRRYAVESDDFEEIHYCNVLPSGATFDSTAGQYAQFVRFTITVINLKGHASARERYLADPETRKKYELVRERVARELAGSDRQT